MDDGDAGPQSLFVAVSWDSDARYCSSIIHIETPQVHNASSPIITKISTEFSAHIARSPRLPRCISCAISLPTGNSVEDLYMLPSCIFNKYEIEKVGKFPSFTFNWRTKKCKIIKASLAPKFLGHAVTMGDHIYYMAQPCVDNISPDPRFERFDTLTQSWEEREPLRLYREPDPCIRLFPRKRPTPRHIGLIQGTAVLDDTILIILENCEMWAYNAGRDKWYLVDVSDNLLCSDIVGAAVVVNKIIYAMARFSESVLAMTLKSREIKGDLVFTCNLRKEYVVPGIEQLLFDRRELYKRTKHLVHLGKDNFCVVRCFNRCDVGENQYIQVTYIKVSDEKSIVTNICLHELKLPRFGEFTISHCFIMPKCKTTTALKEGSRLVKLNPEHKAEIVTLPPELLQFHDKYSLQTSIIDKQDTTPQVQEDVPKKSSASVVAGNSNVPTKAKKVKAKKVSGQQYLNYDDHSVFIRKLPPDAMKVYKGLKRFGPIKNFDSNIGQNITASPIKIGDRLAVIEEKRGTSLTQGGSVTQTSQSRDDVDTTPQVQEDVPKKSSASVVVADKSNLPSKASTVTGSQSAGCHSICVTNLPPNTNDRQLLKRLKRFGPIKSVRIQTYTDNNMMSECSADVEFENATSKKNAIKASTIKIGDRLAAIE